MSIVKIANQDQVETVRKKKKTHSRSHSHRTATLRPRYPSQEQRRSYIHQMNNRILTLTMPFHCLDPSNHTHTHLQPASPSLKRHKARTCTMVTTPNSEFSTPIPSHVSRLGAALPFRFFLSIGYTRNIVRAGTADPK